VFGQSWSTCGLVDQTLCLATQAFATVGEGTRIVTADGSCGTQILTPATDSYDKLGHRSFKYSCTWLRTTGLNRCYLVRGWGTHLMNAGGNRGTYGPTPAINSFIIRVTLLLLQMVVEQPMVSYLQQRRFQESWSTFGLDPWRNLVFGRTNHKFVTKEAQRIDYYGKVETSADVPRATEAPKWRVQSGLQSRLWNILVFLNHPET
jgi:hypothetical protein